MTPPPGLVADLSARAASAGLIPSASLWTEPDSTEWRKAWAAICQGEPIDLDPLTRARLPYLTRIGTASGSNSTPRFHTFHTSQYMFTLCVLLVWASKWTERAWLSRRARGIPDDDLFMAVLLQQVRDLDLDLDPRRRSVHGGAAAGAGVC